MRRSLARLGGACAAAAGHPCWAEQASGATEAAIVVIATPLGDLSEAVDRAPKIDQSRAASLAEQLARTAPGVSLAEVAGNPLQGDISYRGFTASPLLGTPQGLSVYLDGVRLNQPFGEVVSWDLIPQQAIAGMTLIAGAAPQFGRNALGGALVLRSKDGRSDPGAQVQASGGSFGRATLSGQAGGRLGDPLDWYVALDHFREDGWRAFSASRATRAFAKLRWSEGDSGASLSGLWARTDLAGSGLQDVRLLAADRSSAYTAPDDTLNRTAQLALTGEHRLSGALTLRGNLFWRRLHSATRNGDVNDDVLGEDPYQPTAAEQAALLEAGYSGFPLAGETQANTPFPRWRCIANVLLNDAPNETCNALLNRSQTAQNEWGGGAELVLAAPLAGLANRLTLGFSYARSTARFTQSTQFAYLLPDRAVAAVPGPGAMADGTQNSDTAFDARVDLHAVTNSLGAYLADSLDLSTRLRLDLAARFDRIALRNRDGITPGGGTGSLDSEPTYHSVNPAVVLSWQTRWGPSLTASWSQAARAVRDRAGLLRPRQPLPLAQCTGGGSAAATGDRPQHRTARCADAASLVGQRQPVPHRQP